MGEECYEVPVGFKHIVNVMQQHNALLGGESSGGLTIRGHILGKDGIFASALVVEMLARTGQKISELRDRVYAITGPLYDLEEDIPATPEMRIAVPRLLKEAPSSHIGRYPVTRISHADGTKLLLENDNWALLRFSGTEPVLRLSVQADTEEKASGADSVAAAVCDGEEVEASRWMIEDRGIQAPGPRLNASSDQVVFIGGVSCATAILITRTASM
jgi:phosphomannomutase